jgi:hypothetical protein
MAGTRASSALVSTPGGEDGEFGGATGYNYDFQDTTGRVGFPQRVGGKMGIAATVGD